MALAAEGVRARIYSCRKAFRLSWALAPAALFHLRKWRFSASSPTVSGFAWGMLSLAHDCLLHSSKYCLNNPFCYDF